MSDSTEWPDWLYNMGTVAYATELVGFYAIPFRSNTTMADLAIMLADFYAQNPNLTNATEASTQNTMVSVASLLGTTTSQLQTMWFQNVDLDADDPTGIMVNRQMFGAARDYILTERQNLFTYKNPLTALEPTFVVLNLVAVTLLIARFYARSTYAHQILAADWAMLLGFVLSLVMGILIIYYQAHIITYQVWVWDQTYDYYGTSTLWLDIIYATYPIPLLAIKSSWLLFYFSLTSWKYLRWTVIATFVFTLGNTIAGFATQLWCVRPIDFWNHPFSYDASLDLFDSTDNAFIATSALNMVTDITIWVLPIRLVYKLSLTRQERLLSFATFGSGLIAWIASVLRLVYIYKAWLDPPTLHANLNLEKAIPAASQILLYTMYVYQIEMYLGIIGGCMPAVRALMLGQSGQYSRPRLGEIHLHSSETSDKSTMNKTQDTESGLQAGTDVSSDRSVLEMKIQDKEPGHQPQTDINYVLYGSSTR